MKLNPEQAPLYGECVLTVQLSEGECAEDEDEVEFYLLFSGSTQRHLTSTLRVSHVTLQAVCPAHDRDETVQVTLCQARPGGSVDAVSEEQFQYVHDLALNMARLLISATAHKDGLEGALLLEDAGNPLQECETLDETLAQALKHLPLPTGWSVLGTDVTMHGNTDPAPHETLLHFAARRGLRRVALFLLQQPGGRDALQLLNKHGHTPARLAQRRGDTHLQHLLSELEKSPRLETKPPRRRHPQGRRFLHHPRLNTYTLTTPRHGAADPPDLERDVEELRRYVRARQQDVDAPLKHLPPVPLILNPDFAGYSQTVEVTPSAGPSPPKTAACDRQEVAASESDESLDVSRSVVEADLQRDDSGCIVELCPTRAGESASEGKPEDVVTVGALSCAGQQQQQEEEVDKDPSTIRAERQAPSGSESEAGRQIQAGSAQDGSMGQTQGLLPKEALEESENNEGIRGLPEEGEGADAEQPSEGQDQWQDSCSGLNREVEASAAKEEPSYHKLSREERGNRSEQIDLKGETNLFSKAEPPNPAPFTSQMAPGPVHNVRLEPPTVVEKSSDGAPGDTAACGEATEGLPDQTLEASGADFVARGGENVEGSRAEHTSGSNLVSDKSPSELRSENAGDEEPQSEALSEMSCGDDGGVETSGVPAGSLSEGVDQIRGPERTQSPSELNDFSSEGSQKTGTSIQNAGDDKSELDSQFVEEISVLLSRMCLTPGSSSKDVSPETITSVDSLCLAAACGSSKEESISKETRDGKSESLDCVASDALSEPPCDAHDQENFSRTGSFKGTSSPLSNHATEFKIKSMAVSKLASASPGPEENFGGTSLDASRGLTFMEESTSETSDPHAETTVIKEPEGRPLQQKTEDLLTGEHCFHHPPEVTISEETAFDRQLEEMTGEQTLDQSEVHTFEELFKDPLQDQPELTSIEQPDGEPYLDQPKVTTNVEPIKEVSLDQREVTSVGEPKLKVTMSEEPVGEPLFHHQLWEKAAVITGKPSLDHPVVTTSEKPFEEPFLNPTEVSISTEPVKEPSLKQPEITACEDQAGEPSLNQQLEARTSAITGKASEDQPEVTTSEEPLGEPSLAAPENNVSDVIEASKPDAVEDTRGTSSVFMEPSFDKHITPTHDLQLEATTFEEPRIVAVTSPSEEDVKISLEASKMENVFCEAQKESAGQEPPAAILNTSRDSGLALENSSTSDPLGVSTHPVEVGSPLDSDSGTSLDVQADSSAIQDSDMGGVCGSVDVACGREPNEEPRGGDAAGAEAGLDRADQCEIHRDSEVLCSLASEDLREQNDPGNTCPDGPVTGVCRSVSAGSLPESFSDGDSLLEPEAVDDNVFKQTEDTVTLTSGISVSGSLSTYDSSSTRAVREPDEEERKDRLAEVLQRSVMLRSTARSLSPSRRHSWGPTKNQSGEADVGQRSYSLDGLDDDEPEEKSASVRNSTHSSTAEREDQGSLASLTEEEHETNMGDNSSADSQRSIQDVRSGLVPPQTLTKSVSMLAISARDLDAAIGRVRPRRRISFSFSMSPRRQKPKSHVAFGSSSSDNDDEEASNLGPLVSAAGSLEYSSICEEDPAPLRSDIEVRGTKVSRTFSYLKNKMSKKKEKDRDKNKDGKEKEKRSFNGHLFSSASTPPTTTCPQCNRPISTKDTFTCTNCGLSVHKGCRDGLPACAKVKMKLLQQQSVPDSASMPGIPTRGKSASARERPWSTIALPEDHAGLPVPPPPRKNATLMPFTSNTLSKSISISNITGQADDAPLKLLKALSHSTDSLNKLCRVNESTESLTDEGAELMDGHLMAEFEADVKELEADSWSFTVDKKYLKQLKKEVIKRQDVIYELIQTELHHVRTLRIMADVYNKGLQKELQLESQMLEKMFPVLDELLELHTRFLTHLLERKREFREEEGRSEGGFVIRRIGDVLLNQVTGSNAERMKKVYGKFCSRHNEAVNVYKELHARDKRFQAFIKRKMSSAVVRRLSIPECILLITQRLTKYPVLLQRILQHTRDPEEEQADVAEALRQVKEVITGVDSKVNDYENRKRLKEVYSRTDSKSIMRMKSGQMFAREDLLRGRKLLHDGALQLKNVTGRLKDVQALLLSDVFVFLQEKDQKYVFASLDQRSTVISLQKLIVREVANEERGLFFITAGIERPEMVEVHASSKDERNTWMQLIRNATNSIEKDDDEGIPSENEEDKRLQESKAREMRDKLQKRDEQIVALLEEKMRLFRELCDCASQDEAAWRSRMMFRATNEEVTKGDPIVRDALKEVDTLQDLVNSCLVGQQVCVGQDGSGVGAGTVSLPRRSETFGGFDSHQMNVSKNGERDEAEDLRRTESDSVLKKGGSANLLLLHKRNSEQVLQSVTRLHDLLSTLQAVVIQQDTFIEDQRQALSSWTHRHPSVSSFSSLSSCSSSSSRPGSLMEQERQRQEEKQREEERRKKEEEERKKEEELARREERLLALEEENQRRRERLQQEQQDLSSRKEEYQRELLKLRDDQRRLEREQGAHQHAQQEEARGRHRTSSTTSEDSLKLQSSMGGAEEVEVFSRLDSKRKAKNLNPFSSGQKGGATAEPHSQIPTRLLQLAKTKDKKEKKKKKGKGASPSQPTELQAAAAVPDTCPDKEVYFC